MSKRYETGSRKLIIELMTDCAVRDQLEIIDSLTQVRFLDVLTQKPEPKIQMGIDNCKKLMRDFKRLRKTLLGEKS